MNKALDFRNSENLYQNSKSVVIFIKHTEGNAYTFH